METIDKTSGTLISDIERHYKEICKERGIDPVSYTHLQVREKIAEYQEKLKALEVQKTEAENLEIVQMVRALRMLSLIHI